MLALNVDLNVFVIGVEMEAAALERARLEAAQEAEARALAGGAL